MKFIVNQQSLAKALGVVGKGLASTAGSAILSGILIRAQEGTIELQTTNQTIHIRDRIAAMVEEDGAVVVAGKTFTNVVKSLPDAAVEIATDGTQLSISCERSRFKLNTLSADDFPEFPSYALERSVELPAEVLSQMEQRVSRAVSRDSSRPILTGILLTLSEGALRMVATDTFRMAVCDTQVEGADLENFEMIVPAGAFHDVLSFAGGEGEVLVGVTQNQVVFETGDVTYVSRRIEGTFPNYRAILPESSSTQISCKVDALDQVLRRMTTIASSHPSVTIEVDADGQLMTISAKSPDAGEATETLAAKISGDNVTIILNYRYVFDCLGALKDVEDVAIELRSSREPALFKALGKVSYLYLLMPLRD